jgi:hypothetical protein
MLPSTRPLLYIFIHQLLRNPSKNQHADRSRSSFASHRSNPVSMSTKKPIEVRTKNSLDGDFLDLGFLHDVVVVQTAVETAELGEILELLEVLVA